MYARKWLPNSEVVLSHIPAEDQATEMKIEETELHGAKTLGILLLARDDVFTFHFKPVDDDFVYTKRNVLTKVALLFDPLGFLLPYTIRAKILLQMMWSCGLDWDEQLDSIC